MLRTVLVPFDILRYYGTTILRYRNAIVPPIQILIIFIRHVEASTNLIESIEFL